MTIDEFNKVRWYPNMIALYKDSEHPISGVDFDEALLSLKGITRGSDEPNWVRCENIEIVE